MTKLIVAFRNFAKDSKSASININSKNWTFNCQNVDQQPQRKFPLSSGKHLFNCDPRVIICIV